MDALLLTALLAISVALANRQQQRERVRLLGSYLGHYQIEQLMENLMEGYLRAMGEKDPERRAQIWRLLTTTENQLCEQFTQFATEFAAVPSALARVSTIAFALPYADRLLPRATFDLRGALAIHAKGINDAILNADHLSPRDRAFRVSAELLLMQHTCHWFCKSKVIASARMLARHKTHYQQLLDAVSPQTRAAYQALLAG